MTIQRPDPATYAPYFQQYVDQVPEGDLLFTLTSQVESTCALVAGFGEEGALHRYAEGKWSVKEVVGHVIDMERLFGCRALSFARGDTTPLPSVEEDEWAAASNANALSLSDLLDELLAVRRATVAWLGFWRGMRFIMGGSFGGGINSAHLCDSKGLRRELI